jgi:hypothetical protein
MMSKPKKSEEEEEEELNGSVFVLQCMVRMGLTP